MTRVLLVSRQSLFRSGLASLMSRQARIEIVGQEEDPNRALERVQELVPDVVIIDKDRPGFDVAEFALGIFRAGLRVRIVELSLENNAMYIYRRELRIAHQVEDLMSAIESDVSISDLVSSEELTALATARSRIYGFLGAVFNRLPNEQFVGGLSSPEMAAFLASIGELEDHNEGIREGLRLLEAYITHTKDRPVEEVKTELGVERTRLVRGIKPDYGPPPPYEWVHAPRTGDAPGLTTAIVRNAYAESHAALPEIVREEPDFIGIELDFMRYLTEKEGAAWESDQPDGALQVIGKERAFLDEHILVWIPKFCDVMLEQARIDFFRGIALLTKGFALGEASRVKELSETSAVYPA